MNLDPYALNFVGSLLLKLIIWTENEPIFVCEWFEYANFVSWFVELIIQSMKLTPNISKTKQN